MITRTPSSTRTDILLPYPPHCRSFIATMTGVPVDQQDRVRGCTDDLIARDDKQRDLSERNIGDFINMAQYFEAHSAQHANGPLGNDLLGTMLRAEKDGVLQHAQVVEIGRAHV